MWHNGAVRMVLLTTLAVLAAGCLQAPRPAPTPAPLADSVLAYRSKLAQTTHSSGSSVDCSTKCRRAAVASGIESPS
jgi:hypothetical protein